VAGFPGVAHGEWQWMTGLSVGTGYDSNVQLTQNGESDYVFEVGPSMEMKYRGASVELTGDYNISASTYAMHRDLNQISQNLILDADISNAMTFILPKESAIHVRETFYNAPYLPGFQPSASSTTDVTTGGVRTPRNTTTRNVFQIDESTPLTQLTKVGVSFINSFTWYQDPTLTDDVSHEVRIGLSTDLNRIDTLSEGVSYQRYEPYGGPITNIYHLGIRNEHKFSPITTGAVDVGYGWVVLPAPTKPESSFVGGFSGSTELTKTLSLSGRIEHGFSTSSGVGNTALLSDLGNLYIEERFTGFLTGRLSLNAARNYSLPGHNGVDIRTWETAADLGYKLTSWLGTNLRYSYSRQADIGDFPYRFDRSVIGLNLQAGWN